jgi:hypothetical protein
MKAERFPDTSKAPTDAVIEAWVRDISTPREKIPTRTFYPQFSANGKQLVAPDGYAFNRRGDLVSLKREAKRRAA